MRLLKILDLGAEHDVLHGIVKNASAEDLGKLRRALDAKAAELLPVVTQLSGAARTEEIENGFLI